MKKSKLKHKLALALQQLQEYSDNEFIIIGGEELNIADTLKELEVKPKSPKVELKSEKKTVFKLGYSNFERFVNSIYGGNYEIQPDICCDNDSTHEFDAPDIHADKDLVLEVKKGNYPSYCTEAVFQALHEDGHIETGEYLVEVSY